MSNLGSVVIPNEVKGGLKHYERLEGIRKAEKLIAEAASAYLKVLTSAIEKDATIKAEMAAGKSKTNGAKGEK
jgi:hypothetical protein